MVVNWRWSLVQVSLKITSVFLRIKYDDDHGFFPLSVHFDYLTVWKKRRQLKRLDNNNVGEFSLLKNDVETGNNNNRNFNNNIIISNSNNNRSSSNNKCFRRFLLRCYNCYSTCCKLKKTLLPFLFVAAVYVIMYSISVQNINEKILSQAIVSNETTIHNSGESK